jgi:hypothetical protein
MILVIRAWCILTAPIRSCVYIYFLHLFSQSNGPPNGGRCATSADMPGTDNPPCLRPIIRRPTLQAQGTHSPRNEKDSRRSSSPHNCKYRGGQPALSLKCKPSSASTRSRPPSSRCRPQLATLPWLRSPQHSLLPSHHRRQHVLPIN